MTAPLSGLLFGVGLVVSDMADPTRVLAFLTLGPNWDPTLAFVMIGALTVAGAANLLRRGSERAVDGTPLAPSPSTVIDLRLLAGGALFGLGWGLSGYCPGPALAGAALGASSAWALVPTMLLGGLVTRWWLTRR